MVKFSVSPALQRLCRKCRDFLRCLWGFICRWCSRLTQCVGTAFGWRRAGGETNDGAIRGEDDFLRPGASGENEGRERDPAADSSGISEDDESKDDLSDEDHDVGPLDELYCEYDSTWEEEEVHEKRKKTRCSAPVTSYKFRRFVSAAKDMQNYRHGYPANTQYAGHSDGDMTNLEFYLGRRPSLPDEMYIHDFHNWFENYDALESVHTYIQWLFPLQEPGMNSSARTLTKAEIQEFCKSNTATANLLESYKLMLNFYGIRLCDENTGEVERAAHWKERFDNLNSHTHNSLRITRILKCLGTLGYPHYQSPLVHFFLKETLENRNLPRIRDSVLNYFVFAVLDKKQRQSLIEFAFDRYEPKDDFVWCPKYIQTKWLRDLMSNRKQVHSTDDLGVDHDD
ncbi:opioid growth factor receptor-like [Betta splendens]|uniref:Opioid growth factor receptor-like n=1 Tax=Betta splendens TaxID=158456 RepID=A0A6P7MH36_BETSP|nr:opioid growth factor receptor-like [Betta splendens]